MSARPDMRRGACPSLPEPMQTGDGLLARLQPLAPLTLDQVAGLARLAAERGNGILEVTARGKLQLRGLSAATAPGLPEAVAALDITVPQGFPVEVSALAGRDPAERFDPRPLARAISERAAPLVPDLAPKASVVVDGGGRFRLGGLKADIALSAGDGGLSLALAGVPCGAVEAARAAEVVIALLQRLAARGPAARMADLVAAEGIAPLRTAYGLAPPDAVPGEGADPVGPHKLKDGSVALGIGLAFGQIRAAALGELVAAARRAGVAEVEPAAGRALLLLGLTTEAAEALREAAAGLGFLTHAADPRRRVFACAGRPACASARLDTHALAATLVPLLAGRTLHVSGCPKGCAHPSRAGLTIVGLDEGAGLVVEGTPRDLPARIVPPAQLYAMLQKDLA